MSSMNVNATKLEAMRDSVITKYKISSEDELNLNASELVLVTALNALLRVANDDGISSDEVKTLTETGRILVDRYVQSYERNH